MALSGAFVKFMAKAKTAPLGAAGPFRIAGIGYQLVR
jgi:hypothetical protein